MQWNSDRALHPVFGKHPGSCFVAIPNLIISDVSDSNITARGHQDQRTYQEKQKWDISLYEFPFQKDIVSIIVPMFNAASTIERSVRSLMRQTYREIEIIVVDDGSTDECADLVRSLGMEDSRIRLIASESNRGCYHARNLGIRSANGKYITFHDADDISLTTRIEQQLLLLIRKRVKLTITKMIRSIKDIRDKDFNSDDSLLDFVQSGDSESGNPMEPFRLIMPFGLVTSLYHRSVFEKHGLFWEERFSGDAEFLERVLFHETGLRFPFEGKTAYQYLSEKKSIEGLFEYVDSILYVCLPRSSHNLSRQYLQDGEERKSFRERYRRKLAGQEDYYYPRL
jgi:glycosyltransferase involved in cell wall biosynthesis